MGLPRFGGIGGRGGNVYVKTAERATLASVVMKDKKKRFHAGSGDNSTPRGVIGKPGADFTIEIPPGVSVYGEEGTLLGKISTSYRSLPRIIIIYFALMFQGI